MSEPSSPKAWRAGLPDGVFAPPARPRISARLAERAFVAPSPGEMRGAGPESRALDSMLLSMAGGLGDGLEPHHRRRAAEPGLPPSGTILDKYRLEEVVGTGGFAVVYRSTHLLLQRTVALKLLRPRVARRKPHLATILFEEARLAAQLDHPNVVRILDVAHTDAMTYVVMEYIEGRSLSRLIREYGPLSPLDVATIGLGVVAGLRAGHQKGIIHRDVKPSNILITPQGVVKLVDLGLAQAGGAWSGPADVFQRPSLPAIVGTPGYMSPEQSQRPTEVDFRSDIYSLGVTLYQAVAGQAPFPMQEGKRDLTQAPREPALPLSEQVPGVDRPLAALIERMMSLERSTRPISYDALWEELSALRSRLVEGAG